MRSSAAGLLKSVATRISRRILGAGLHPPGVRHIVVPSACCSTRSWRRSPRLQRLGVAQVEPFRSCTYSNRGPCRCRTSCRSGRRRGQVLSQAYLLTQALGLQDQGRRVSRANGRRTPCRAARVQLYFSGSSILSSSASRVALALHADRDVLGIDGHVFADDLDQLALQLGQSSRGWRCCGRRARARDELQSTPLATLAVFSSRRGRSSGDPIVWPPSLAAEDALAKPFFSASVKPASASFARKRSHHVRVGPGHVAAPSGWPVCPGWRLARTISALGDHADQGVRRIVDVFQRALAAFNPVPVVAGDELDVSLDRVGAFDGARCLAGQHAGDAVAVAHRGDLRVGDDQRLIGEVQWPSAAPVSMPAGEVAERCSRSPGPQARLGCARRLLASAHPCRAVWLAAGMKELVELLVLDEGLRQAWLLR